LRIQEPVNDSVSVVLVGSFNPRIFHPAWFAAENLIAKADADTAEVALMHPAAAAISLGPFELRVFSERFVATSAEALHYLPLRDLIVGTFTILRHTPVRAVGINREMHFRVNGDVSWSTMQKALGRSTPWSDALRAAQTVGIDLRGLRENDLAGHLAVRLEPSAIEEDGVLVRVNDHYAVEDSEPHKGLRQAVETVEREFATSISRSLQTAKDLLEVTCRR
jgi:hypothetical protein